MILRNGRLIFPEEIRDDLELVVRRDKIEAIRPVSDEADDQVIDLQGSYLAPGFIDLHVHGAVGRDTMEASEEAFRAICDFHATGGTTSLLLTTVTAPIPRLNTVLGAVRQLQPDLPQVLGAHVEGPFISRQKCGAQSASHIIQPNELAVQALLQFDDVIRIMTLAPEVKGAPALIEKLRARNIIASGGHSDADEFEARAAFAAGLRHTTHTFNCMSSSRRRGLDRVGGLLEFALSEPEVVCELIADGHHVSPTLMQLLYRAKGPRGICLVTDATAGAGLPNESHFTLGGTDCIVSDGVCLLGDRSALAGSASRMIDLVRQMVHAAKTPLPHAVQMATTNPARALGLAKTKGMLQPGADADLLILSPELDVQKIFLAGHARDCPA